MSSYRFTAVVARVLLSAVALSASVQASADDDAALVARGKQMYMLCQSCHAVDEQSGGRIGPHLAGIYQRPVASLEGYNYSQALRGQDFAWDAAKLDTWLQRPYDLVPNTSMSFAGVASEDMRKALIAYLKTL